MGDPDTEDRGPVGRTERSASPSTIEPGKLGTRARQHNGSGPRKPRRGPGSRILPRLGRPIYLLRCPTPRFVSDAPRSGLAAVAAQVGFAIDDYEAANDAFRAWRASGTDADLKTVQLWAYAYIQRYFVARFASERYGSASDLDAAITRTFTRVLDALDRVETSFASYVSVACKRVLLNHRRDRKQTTEVYEDTLTRRDREAGAYDRQLERRVIERAFDTLPASIATVGRMRYLDQREYHEIAETTGHPIATVRAYAGKVRTRLATHGDLRALYFDDVLPAGVGSPEG